MHVRCQLNLANIAQNVEDNLYRCSDARNDFSKMLQSSYHINGYQCTIYSYHYQYPELSKFNVLFWTTLGIAFVAFLRLNKIVESLVNKWFTVVLVNFI